MIPIQTKEHLIYFMQCGMIRLSKHDLRFMKNILELAIANNKITSNQVLLFDKLVDKYKRQLNKHGLTNNMTKKLSWNSEIIDSDSKFTEAYISIENAMISFTSPFNKKFITALGKVNQNTFRWNKQKKIHESKFSTYALKIIIEQAHQHYPVVNYCPLTVELMAEVNRYKTAIYWSPTLVKVNNNYLIAASNPHVDAAIRGIELTEKTECISTLAAHGILIAKDITDSDPMLEFASKYIVDVDYKYLDEVIYYLINLKCDGVFITGNSGMMLQHRRTLKEKLALANIQVHVITGGDQSEIQSIVENMVNPVNISLSSSLSMVKTDIRFKKIIIMKNSLPVDIK